MLRSATNFLGTTATRVTQAGIATANASVKKLDNLPHSTLLAGVDTHNPAAYQRLAPQNAQVNIPNKTESANDNRQDNSSSKETVGVLLALATSVAAITQAAKNDTVIHPIGLCG